MSQIQFVDWGLIEYNEAWSKQEALFSATIERKVGGIETDNFLVFCEHPHVYTLGKSGDEQNLLLNYIQLQAKHASFVQTNRGGDITYHGPGQVVGYPIFDLANFNLGLKQYIHYIEEAIIHALSLYNIQSSCLDGATGVWIDVGLPTCRKICAIGVRSSRFVTMHGFALNVNTQLEYFNYINPCGFIDKGVTSMEKELGHKVDIEQLKLALRTSIQNQFVN
ncbi:lipoate-protein ligase B [Paludibacter propionicigenes WB4]|uniref:Octanoyltransferase n=1 Tax=Paludibacter propionicigenes (strain DSM 17365 / JCM 13257 / WB4) TaxID=694427 RepID=E4T0G4_PALPW|nr:lipoyl(octanoyl) transferase LipB [Paludibacter propionicigenes]ADQ78323.1 lipoate-protein ligase B [Paludibacter propionicigenes WB4]